MRNRLAPLALSVLLALAAPASAEEDGLQAMIEKLTTDEQVRKTIDGVLRNIDKLKCGGAQCEMTTAAELAAPPVTVDQGRDAMRRGLASGIMDWCGGNWQGRILTPMILEAKARNGLSDRQATILMSLHASQQYPLKKSLESKGVCPPDLKAKMTQNTFSDPGTAGFDPNTPVPGLKDVPGRDGESTETALVIDSPQGSAGAVRAELIWIGRRHPGAKKVGQSLLGVGGRQIDRIDIETKDGAKKSYFFDITDAFGLPR